MSNHGPDLSLSVRNYWSSSRVAEDAEKDSRASNVLQGEEFMEETGKLNSGKATAVNSEDQA